jgi:phospholipid/cholesterol/gamma-HCH transport system substrate-binding protein
MTVKSTINHQIRVGIFIFGGLAVTLISMFMVGGESVLKSNVLLHAEFDHVEGLNEGSLVALSGFKVGNIKTFKLLPEKGKIDVIMKIDKAYLGNIDKSDTVEVRSAGALGDKYIFIVPTETKTGSVQEGDVLEVAASTDLISVLSKKGGDAAKFFDILNDVHKMTQAITSGNKVEIMMKNLTDASHSMKVTSDEMRQKLGPAMTKMDRIMTKIDSGQGTIGALINDPSLHDSLKAMVGGPDRKKNMKSLIRSTIDKNKQ